MENNETCFKHVETASCCAPKSSKTFTTSKCPRRAARCKAVAPCAFDTSFKAPASNKSLTTARWPSCEAKCRGVVPLSVTWEVLQRGTVPCVCVYICRQYSHSRFPKSWISHPESKNHLEHSEVTASFAAPFSNNTCTASTRPLEAARCIGVMPSAAGTSLSTP